MTGGLVTVIIRSMGRLMLHLALGSVGAQEYEKIEVSVVAASGSAHAALAPNCGPFPLRLVGTGQRLSRAEAANVGLESARGEYCVFLDDDDFHDPDHISGLMATLEANRQARVAFSGIKVIGADGAKAGVIESPFDRLALHERNYIQIGAALFDRRLVAEGCRFDPDVGAYDDWDFWLQCAQRTDFAFRGRATTNWRADIGESGAGGGANFDPAINETSLAAVHGKWAAVRSELRQRFDALCATGAAALARGDLQQAENCYREAVRIHGTNPDALNQLARLLHARHASAEGLSCLRTALRMHPERTDIACNLARVEMTTGNATAARALLAAVLRREPGNSAANALLQHLPA